MDRLASMETFIRVGERDLFPLPARQLRFWAAGGLETVSRTRTIWVSILLTAFRHASDTRPSGTWFI